MNIAIDAARAGGEVLQKYWGKIATYREKSTQGDLVTEADIASEKKIIELIQANFPDHVILSEESGKHEAREKDYLWVIDPLDGTTNYTHQYPFVAVSIALLHKGEPIVGVVYNPILEELFQAEKGKGAHKNGQPIQVSTTPSLEQSLLATGFAYDRRDTPDNNYKEFCVLTHISHGVRRAGAAALDLAYVASGQLDGFWERGLHPWDIAAGTLLIREAGGKVTAYDQSPLDLFDDQILATNGHIHKKLSDQLLQLPLRDRHNFF